MTSDDYELVVPGHPASLSLIRSVVTRLADAAGLSELEVDRVELAVDEACSNVIDHAYARRDPKPQLRLTIRHSDDAFTVDIIDEGESFDLAHYKEPKFPDHWMEEGHHRGAGLFLINRCMDEVSYEQLSKTQNRMRLIKRCSHTENAAAG